MQGKAWLWSVRLAVVWRNLSSGRLVLILESVLGKIGSGIGRALYGGRQAVEL